MFMTRQAAQEQDFSHASEIVQLASQDGRLTLEFDHSAFLPPGNEVATLEPVSNFAEFADASVISAQVLGTSADLTPLVFGLIASVLALLALYLSRLPSDHRTKSQKI